MNTLTLVSEPAGELQKLLFVSNGFVSMSEGKESIEQIKILVLGQSNVGKTSLINRFATNRYNEERRATIGVDFMTKRIKINKDITINCTLWDTAGQEKFEHSIGSAFYRGADGIILVYDCTYKPSLSQLNSWKSEIQLRCDGEVPTIVIANKADLKSDEFDETLDIALEWCREFNFPHLEASAKDGDGVEAAVLAIAARALKAKAYRKSISNRYSNSITVRDSSGKRNRASLSMNDMYNPKEKEDCC